MIPTIIAAAVAFAATNIDDMFVNMLLFAASSGKNEDKIIVTGKLMGTAALLAISLGGALGMQLVAGKYLWVLGYVPVALGIKERLSHSRQDKHSTVEENTPSSTNAISVMAITLAGGADNIGIYIPLLGSFALWQMRIAASVFLAMTGLWCIAARKLADIPAVQIIFRKYKPVLVPAVYIFLGLYIILG